MHAMPFARPHHDRRPQPQHEHHLVQDQQNVPLASRPRLFHRAWAAAITTCATATVRICSRTVATAAFSITFTAIARHRTKANVGRKLIHQNKLCSGIALCNQIRTMILSSTFLSLMMIQEQNFNNIRRSNLWIIISKNKAKAIFFAA